MVHVGLREVAPDDLDAFFAHQQDPEAIRMAAFTAKNPADRSAFDTHWARLLADDGTIKRTITVGERVVGHVLSFDQDGQTEVTCWVDRSRWGQGIASRALGAFLDETDTRPLHARVAKDNTGSLKVLQRCGFTITGEGQGFANGRGHVVEEYLLQLV